MRVVPLVDLELSPVDDTTLDVVLVSSHPFVVDPMSGLVVDSGHELVVRLGPQYPEGPLADLASLGG